MRKLAMLFASASPSDTRIFASGIGLVRETCVSHRSFDIILKFIIGMNLGGLNRLLINIVIGGPHLLLLLGEKVWLPQCGMLLMVGNSLMLADALRRHLVFREPLIAQLYSIGSSATGICSRSHITIVAHCLHRVGLWRLLYQLGAWAVPFVYSLLIVIISIALYVLLPTDQGLLRVGLRNTLIWRSAWGLARSRALCLDLLLAWMSAGGVWEAVLLLEVLELLLEVLGHELEHLGVRFSCFLVANSAHDLNGRKII